MHFEWENNKRLSNIVKHGIDFQDAIIFFESEPICFEDDRHNYGERRYVAFGMIKARLIVTVYNFRNNNIRILSMRKANSRERRLYEQHIKDQLGQG